MQDMVDTASYARIIEDDPLIAADPRNSAIVACVDSFVP